MKKMIIVYDDLLLPMKQVRSITGEKSFGETIFKRVTLQNRVSEIVLSHPFVDNVLVLKHSQDIDKIEDELCLNEYHAIVHMYSNFGVKDVEQLQILLTKALYCNENYRVMNKDQVAMYIFPNASVYKKNLQDVLKRGLDADTIITDAFLDLTNLNQFRTFITGGFDARFFNALEGDEYCVTKRSSKIEKIKAEYQFFYLLPEHMKMWFVMPFEYKEDAKSASYKMERYHMTDIAIRFVHGAISTDEMKDILDKLFYFIRQRETKQVSKQQRVEISDALYIDKLKSRYEELTQYPKAKSFDSLIQMGTSYESLEAIMQAYSKLYDKMTSKGKREDRLVVGHGDLCFSNILYSKEASLLKLIDPKGALEETDLYTDEYYDLAKLSHSICGCYDFFNSGLFQVSIGLDMNTKLSVDAAKESYIPIFREYLEKNGFDYNLVRLYEASLFLSMLPYHMDQPGKVFGFILNAVEIMEELEACMKA